MHKESSVECQCLDDANAAKVKFLCQVPFSYTTLVGTHIQSVSRGYASALFLN